MPWRLHSVLLYLVMCNEVVGRYVTGMQMFFVAVSRGFRVRSRVTTRGRHVCAQEDN